MTICKSQKSYTRIIKASIYHISRATKINFYKNVTKIYFLRLSKINFKYDLHDPKQIQYLRQNVSEFGSFELEITKHH